MTQLRLNRLLVMLLITFSGTTAFSQQIEKLYITMPDRLNPTLSGKARMEMLEYHKAGQSDTVQNRFGAQAYLQAFDTAHNLIVVKNTANAVFEMKLLHAAGGKPVVGIIHTVCGPICHSNVEFYDTAWHKLPLKFTMPLAVKWIDSDKVASTPELDKNWLKKVLENNFVSLRFDPETDCLLATNNSADFLSDSDRKVILPVLKTSPVVYRLQADSWVEKE